MNIVVQTPTVPKAPLWLRRFWVPAVMTLVGVRIWMWPEPSVGDWLLRGLYVVVVPMSWAHAVKQPKPPSATVGLPDSN
jgi:hypothetical protein